MPRGPARRRADGGYTLIEVITTIAIATVVLGLVTGSLIGAMRSSATTTAKLANLDQVRLSVDAMSRNLRAAIRPEQLNPGCSVCSSPFVTATDGSVTFYANVGDTDPADPTHKLPVPTLTSYSIGADAGDRTGKTAAITEVRQAMTGRDATTGDYTWATPCTVGGPAVNGCTARVVGRGLIWPLPVGKPLFTYHAGTATLPTNPAMSASTLATISAVDISLPVGDAAHPSPGINTSVFLPNSTLGH